MNSYQHDRWENLESEGGFEIVRNRRKKSKPKVAVGGAADSNIKAVKRTRMGLLFLTPDTSTEITEHHVKQTSINYKLRDVKLLNAKYKDSYSHSKYVLSSETKRSRIS
ncbi:unnamed protein product [Orchesella dallaii]|uniref:Uncharacterized protein n=1 Tax=Orchesella dallaii TaxID=48710 RepID=A0ABP1S0A8_9HEXA